MSDSYQAIYDAVRSRISGGNISDAVAEACRNAFDISHTRAILQEQFCATAMEMARPSVLFKPTLTADGDMWCALLGADLQVGVAGFGKTPADAMLAFDAAFYKELTPGCHVLAIVHDSDCALHNEPAFPNGPCNCSVSNPDRAAERERLRQAALSPKAEA